VSTSGERKTRKTVVEARERTLRLELLDGESRRLYSVQINESSGYEDPHANYRATGVVIRRGEVGGAQHLTVDFDDWPSVRDAVDQAIKEWKAEARR
jgi:hypothetical protein